MPVFTAEVTSKLAPSRLFQVATVDLHDVVPKIIPEVVSGVSLVQGNGGVGTVKQFKFTDALPFDCLKERVELLDKRNLEYTHSWIEGGRLGGKLQSATYNIKLQPAADGGSVVKYTADYRPKPGAELTREDMEADKADFLGMLPAVEEKLVANPPVCA